MPIDAHWQQAGIDALRAMLDVDAALKRRMIEYLFESGFWDQDRLSWDGAVARFNACLNPASAQFFKLGEIWALAKRFERFQVFEAMADDLGFDLRRKTTEERRQALLERIAQAAEQHNALLERYGPALEQLEQAAPGAQRLHPSSYQRGSHFCLDGDEAAGHEPGGF